jgi:hypothetical protein
MKKTVFLIFKNGKTLRVEANKMEAFLELQFVKIGMGIIYDSISCINYLNHVLAIQLFTK